MWIWYSKKYAHKHPDIVKKVRRASTLPFMSDNISQILVYLAGIHSPYYRPQYNPLEDEYDHERRRILKGGKADYDKLRAEKDNSEEKEGQSEKVKDEKNAKIKR